MLSAINAADLSHQVGAGKGSPLETAGTTNCLTGITPADQKILNKINIDLTSIQGLRPDRKSYSESIERILDSALPQLSPAGQTSALAKIHEHEINYFVAALNSLARSEKFKTAYQEFNRNTSIYLQHRARWGGGLFSASNDLKNLQKSKDQIVAAINNSSITAEEKNKVAQTFRSAFIVTTQQGAERFSRVIEHAAFFHRPEVALGAAILVVAIPTALVGAGGAAVAASTAAATGAYGTAAVYGAVGGVLGGGAIGSATELTKMIGNSSARGSDGVDVLCAFAEEIRNHGPAAVKRVMITAAISGGLGAALAVAPVVPVLGPAAQRFAGVVAVGAPVVGAFSTWKQGQQAQQLFNLAATEIGAGDEGQGRKHLEEARRLAVDAKVTGVATVLGSVLLAKNAGALRAQMSKAKEQLEAQSGQLDRQVRRSIAWIFNGGKSLESVNVQVAETNYALELQAATRAGVPLNGAIATDRFSGILNQAGKMVVVKNAYRIHLPRSQQFCPFCTRSRTRIPTIQLLVC